MENTLSKEAKAKQKVCLKELAKLIAKGYHIGLDLKHIGGDYIEVNLYVYDEEAQKALRATELEIRAKKGIWFDSAFTEDGVREWSLDYCLEDKKEIENN